MLSTECLHLLYQSTILARNIRVSAVNIIPFHFYVNCYTRNMLLIATAFIAAVTALIVKNRRYRWIYILAKTYSRDARGGLAYLQLNLLLWIWGKQNKTVASVFSSLVKKHPQKVAFYFEDDIWSFQRVDEFSNKIGRYFKKQGFERGDCVALLLENRAEYPCLWIGLAKTGVITSLINTNLVSDSLLHSLNVCKCKAVIFGSNHTEAIKNIMHNLSPSIKLYQFNEDANENHQILSGTVDLRSLLDGVSSAPLEENKHMDHRDPLVYIYTSGTTGLPKAAVITNVRFMFMAMGIHYMANLNTNDILYDSLPLYHTAGGMLGIGQAFLAGLSVVIRKRFSASNYWKDCAKYNCTVAQYVGEICRYVLAASQKESIKHSVRTVFGNGLRPQIWKQFVEQFKVENVCELYGATEGISNMVNNDNTVGCVGFIPRYFRFFYPVTLIRCDEAGEPIRNKEGYCIECGINDPGLVIAKINPKHAALSFKGYSDENATEKKILQDVFQKGDLYFNSGDILVGDEFGYFFFRDRTGDTFRWKGENVSTAEIEAVISNLVKLNDAVVYGVEIPETEGKAGMAAIVDIDKTVDLDNLTNGLKSNLPSYAIPVFIRIMSAVPLTGTYKLKKFELQSEGFDINKITDSVYMYNSKLGKYTKLTSDIHEQIIDGKLHL